MTPRWLIGLVGLVMSPDVVRAESVGDAWQMVRQLDWTAGTDQFRRLSSEGGAEQAEADFGLALSLLNTPPKTSARVVEAEVRLERVAAEASPALRTRARYFLGRVAELHRAQVDRSRAREQYDEAITLAPAGDLFGELARVRLVELDLYWGDGAAAAALAEGEEVLAGLINPSARRSLLALLAYAQLFLDGDRGVALRFLEEADGIDETLGTQRQFSYALEPPLVILSAESGRWDLARRMAARFAERYPRDPRVRHLQQLAQGEVAP